VRKEQEILGKPKYPGRCGRLQRLHPFTTQARFDAQLWYVELAPTARAAARVETFWGHQLEIINSGETSPLKDEAAT
jgi:hypothetical protein